jgi:hypothetical protein
MGVRFGLGPDIFRFTTFALKSPRAEIDPIEYRLRKQFLVRGRNPGALPAIRLFCLWVKVPDHPVGGSVEQRGCLANLHRRFRSLNRIDNLRTIISLFKLVTWR